MKLLLIFTFLLSFNSWAKTCYKSRVVKKGDSLYKIFSKFKYKKQYTYKQFLTSVKKENGMTKGSDILKMNNKLISIPYTCIKTKKFARKQHKIKKIIRRGTQSRSLKRKYDPLGLASNSYQVTNKTKAFKKLNIGLQFESTSQSYKSNSISTNEISPASISVSKEVQVDDKSLVLLSGLSARSKIFSNGLKENISAQDFEIDSLITKSFNSYSFGIGLNYLDTKLVNDNLDGTDSYTALGLKANMNYSFNSTYSTSFQRVVTLLHVNPNKTGTTKRSQNIFSANWHFHKNYTLKASYINSFYLNAYENIQKDGFGLSLRLNL